MRTGATSQAIALMLAASVSLAALLVAPYGVDAQTISGKVVDARTGDPVIGALVEVGLTPYYSVAWEDGSFVLELPEAEGPGTGGPKTLVVSAPGYAKRYEPVDPATSSQVVVRLFPDPIELDGIEATVVTYPTRLRRRLNASMRPWYALEGPLLELAREDNVWDLVANRTGLRYIGHGEYGCPAASVHGRDLRVDLFIDDRPVLLNDFLTYAPQDFTRVEIVSFGSEMRAYTQEYLDWMTENEYVAPAFATEFKLCPRMKPPPGTMKRGRPVG
ncbi:MAG: hypothetical protein HKN73_01775 [Gemmatimonadetes bacterium]|nr:hypothetical protein [Gemmatimonadota bacterium]